MSDTSLSLSFKFSNICVSFGEKRHILHGVSGAAETGDMIAILGHSGCGKTTLLDVLSGRLQMSSNPAADQQALGRLVTGTISFNGRRADRIKSIVSYVTQEDALIPTLTVRETVTFFAQLQLPSSVARQPARVDAIVATLLEKARLQHAADTKASLEPGRGMRASEWL